VKNIPLIPLLAIALFTSEAANAQETQTIAAPDIKVGENKALNYDTAKLSENTSPEGAIAVGPAYLYPQVKTGIGYNDNIAKTESNKQSSSIYYLQPQAVVRYRASGNEYQAGYAGTFTRFPSSSQDNIDTHAFQAQAANIYSDRAKSLLLLNTVWSADPRGSTDRPSATEPDRYRGIGASGLFSYGGKEAIGRVEAETTYSNKRYFNNREFTEAADLDSFDLAGRFFYRVGPKTATII